MHFPNINLLSHNQRSWLLRSCGGSGGGGSGTSGTGGGSGGGTGSKPAGGGRSCRTRANTRLITGQRNNTAIRGGSNSGELLKSPSVQVKNEWLHLQEVGALPSSLVRRRQAADLW